MKLLSYGCTNYKPFKDETHIEVKPLTLIYGKNSSGKSTAVRLLRLMLRAMTLRSSKEFPLSVDEISFASTFTDLIFGKTQHKAVSFHAKFDALTEVFEISTEVQHLHSQSDPNRPINTSKISAFSLLTPTTLQLDWIPSEAKITQYENMGEIPFRGLLPETQASLANEQWQAISRLREQASQMEASMTHLGPFRASIKRIYESEQEIALGIDGLGASNQLAKNPELLGKVSDWYKEHMDGWRFTIEPSGIAFACNLSRGNTTINLADAGQGMQQVLPIVVQQLARQLEQEAHFIDLIEQPELHLHTAAQAPLGDLFLETAKLGRGQVIVETHSENILLRIRRRIAEGADPNLVAVYWVEDHKEGHSTMRRIKIDQAGQLDWWCEGVFSEGYEEVRAINRAARAQQNSAG